MTDPIRWFKDWRTGVLTTSAFSRAPLPLGASNAWSFDATALTRPDHRFFSVTGLQYVADGVTRSIPMIDQPEVGLLAFVVRRGASGYEWLMQFKIEPGNTHGAQLGPTVQATLSNLQCAHEGEAPPFVSLVTGTPALLSSGAWSEQGSRFIGKRNENRIVLVDGDVPLPEDDVYRWVPSATVRALLAEEYAVNTDARSVIATGPWDLLASAPDGPFDGRLRASYDAPDRGIGYALEVLTHARKARTPAQPIPLGDVVGIALSPESATPVSHPYFDVHHVLVEAKTREVPRWDQPLVAAHGIGRTVLLLTPDHKGMLRARLSLDTSPGLTRSPEWTATIADVPGDPLADLPAHDVLCQVWGSDEGGRFDNCQNQVIVGITDTPPPPAPDAPYVDLTLGALERLVHTPGAVTNELRTAVALLLSQA